MTILSVRHLTRYRYRKPVAFGEHRLMFRPRDSYDQRLLGVRLDVSPAAENVRWVHDVFGNCVAIVNFSHLRAAELTFTSWIRLDHAPHNELDFAIENLPNRFPFSYRAEEVADLSRCIERQYPDPDGALERWTAQFLSADSAVDSRALLAAMTHAIHERFTYVSREEAGTQDPVTTLRKQSGSCRDFALMMMEAARGLGFAARFVSGYLHSPLRGDHRYRGGGSTHAWVQIYLSGAGWVEFDPTNGIVGNRDLIRVAVARDPSQAVPLSGSWMGFPSDALGMDVEVQVTQEDTDEVDGQSLGLMAKFD